MNMSMSPDVPMSPCPRRASCGLPTLIVNPCPERSKPAAPWPFLVMYSQLQRQQHNTPLSSGEPKPSQRLRSSQDCLTHDTEIKTQINSFKSSMPSPPWRLPKKMPFIATTIQKHMGQTMRSTDFIPTQPSQPAPSALRKTLLCAVLV